MGAISYHNEVATKRQYIYYNKLGLSCYQHFHNQFQLHFIALSSVPQIKQYDIGPQFPFKKHLSKQKNGV